MNQTITQKEIDAMRESFSPECRDKIGDREIYEMVLCDRQRLEDIATGKPYYDYDRQCWIGKVQS